MALVAQLDMRVAVVVLAGIERMQVLPLLLPRTLLRLALVVVAAAPAAMALTRCSLPLHLLAVAEEATTQAEPLRDVPVVLVVGPADQQVRGLVSVGRDMPVEMVLAAPLLVVVVVVVQLVVTELVI